MRMKWYIFKVIFCCCRFLFFLTAMYFTMISNFSKMHIVHCTNSLFSQFIHPALNNVKNISAFRKGFGAELSDMCYHQKTMSLVTLLLCILDTLYQWFYITMTCHLEYFWIPILNLSVKICGYCILIGFHTLSSLLWKYWPIRQQYKLALIG